MTTEDKFAIALGVLSVALLIGGTLVSSVISRAHPKIMRTLWPVVAALTGVVYAAFVFIARTNVKG